MKYFYLVSFVLGLLLGVRLLFFGAERRQVHARQQFPLRKSEPAALAFLTAFGIAGYALTLQTTMTPMVAAGWSVMVAALTSWIVASVAIATVRIEAAHDPEDPRFIHQGLVGSVVVAIPEGGEGQIRFEHSGAVSTVRARDIGTDSLSVGDEVCIERVEDGVAFVERWSLVEQRL